MVQESSLNIGKTVFKELIIMNRMELLDNISKKCKFLHKKLERTWKNQNRKHVL